MDLGTGKIGNYEELKKEGAKEVVPITSEEHALLKTMEPKDRVHWAHEMNLRKRLKETEEALKKEKV